MHASHGSCFPWLAFSFFLISVCQTTRSRVSFARFRVDLDGYPGLRLLEEANDLLLFRSIIFLVDGLHSLYVAKARRGQSTPPASGWPWPHSATSQSGGAWGGDPIAAPKLRQIVDIAHDNLSVRRRKAALESAGVPGKSVLKQALGKNSEGLYGMARSLQ